ncbi:hypothetical protein AMATHDRAFT_66382 [Amanita thiersii Skay4041]|uniref:Uncharacterized protein n=1 Tax=Amanita thiersii Skay4041 TaxID=703135 RepID=A0A2A9NBI4_9AGAR|nr:hypothetical protein AMATHDRAFT_66382 [Amanita thiersii Skay4041]
MTTSSILVNKFTFCTKHGDELCNLCSVDHRLTNNVQIEDELNNLEDVFEFGLEERQPINVYAHGAVAAISTEESYECEDHREIDCSQCFNWVHIIQQETQEVAELGSWLERRERWSAVGQFELYR